jgi:hypothetical protein
MIEPNESRPPSPARLSKTPSWITLGFMLGVLFVWALQHRGGGAAQPVVPAAPAPPVVQLVRPKLTEIEAVFAQWGDAAVWDHDRAEIALWDTEKKTYSIFYEVLRDDDHYYFRSIPKLTRPVLTRGARPESPLLFTETEKTRRAWVEHGQFEPKSGTTVPPDDRPED